jgi:LmbE family N-acetylglucosaminyl deacetylase/2-polyprenyl-3-methyl-5-hydroxy-6-metoxy-1,4-benzoquinol methylase
MSATPVPFDSTTPGTPESEWLGTERWDAVAVLDVAAVTRRYARVLVVSAHPDDETLGVGGLVADLADAGATVEVLVATDGERSHPVDGSAARRDLAAVRRREVVHAVGVLAPDARVEHLGLPDGALAQHEQECAAEVRRRSDPDTLVLAPWEADGHSDHDALARACATAVSASGADLAHYPIWLWHWGSVEALPWEHVVAAQTSRVGSWRKRAALDEFPSQTTPWGLPDQPARTPSALLGPASLERARRLVETLIDPAHALPTVSAERLARRAATRAQQFDAMYDEGDDPWQFADSFYEERRRALVLAVLGCRRGGRALEIGCADGRLTEALVGRCSEVVALDTSHRAVTAATARAPAARVVQGMAPADLPDGPFDLVLLSEVGYFLSPLELLATLRRCQEVLAPGGELVLCHWQHPTQDVPLDGVLVHEQAATVLRAGRRATYADADLRIDVWGDAPSLARQEGRA